MRSNVYILLFPTGICAGIEEQVWTPLGDAIVRTGQAETKHFFDSVHSHLSWGNLHDCRVVDVDPFVILLP